MNKRYTFSRIKLFRTLDTIVDQVGELRPNIDRNELAEKLTDIHGDLVNVLMDLVEEKDDQ